MSFPRFSAVVIVNFGLFSAFDVSANAQSTVDSPSTQQPIYTLHTDKRVVLTDVTVTDRQGPPIHGLNASAFQILDNGKPQNLASFEEHSGPPVESVRSMLQNQASIVTNFCCTLRLFTTCCLSISLLSPDCPTKCLSTTSSPNS